MLRCVLQQEQTCGVTSCCEWYTGCRWFSVAHWLSLVVCGTLVVAGCLWHTGCRWLSVAHWLHTGCRWLSVAHWYFSLKFIYKCLPILQNFNVTGMKPTRVTFTQYKWLVCDSIRPSLCLLRWRGTLLLLPLFIEYLWVVLS